MAEEAQVAKVVVETSGHLSPWIYLVGAAISAGAGAAWQLIIVPIHKRIKKIEETPLVTTPTCDKHLAENAKLREQIFSHIESINVEQMKIAKRLYYIAGRINGGSVPHDF